FRSPEGVLRSSGSKRVSTKLFVPAGAPCQASAGDTLPPEQPNALAVYFSGTLTASLESGLVRTKSAARLAVVSSVQKRAASEASRRAVCVRRSGHELICVHSVRVPAAARVSVSAHRVNGLHPVPVRADDGGGLADLGGNQCQVGFRDPEGIDLDMQLAVGGELGDHAARDEIDVLESLEDASEHAGVSVGDDPESQQGTLWRGHGSNPVEGERSRYTQTSPGFPRKPGR